MKSWVSHILPNDEYKAKTILYFLAEGGIILFITVVGMIISNHFFTINSDFALLIPVAIFLFYVTGRYIISGIEYTDVATVDSYKKELRVILVKTNSFVILYSLLYVLFLGFPKNINDWLELFGLFVLVGLFWFLASYISLKRSYHKNKALL